jgi:uncharacterized protein (TIGR03000 family)
MIRTRFVFPVVMSCIALLAMSGFAQAQRGGGGARGGSMGGGARVGGASMSRAAAPAMRVAPAGAYHAGAYNASAYHGSAYHNSAYHNNMYHNHNGYYYHNGHYYPFAFFGFGLYSPFYSSYGFGYGYPYDPFYGYGTNYSMYSGPGIVDPGYNQPLQQPQQAQGTPPADAPKNAMIKVIVPTADAKVWFDGALTSSTGTERVYLTPDLSPDAKNSYRIRASWIANGKEVVQEHSVPVASGRGSLVDFTRPLSEPVPQPGLKNKE